MEINRMALAKIASSFFLVLAMFGQADVGSNIRDGARPESDTGRDAGRKPAEVLHFLGLQENAIVMDVMASSGYYTEVLAHAVGSEGTVYAQNPPMMLKYRDGFYDKALAQRLKDGRLTNVVRLDRDMGDLGIPLESVDLAITALNFHDIYNSAGESAALELLSQVYGLLKPGGVFGVIDHAGNPEGDNNRLHRMDEAAMRGLIARSAFQLDGSGDLLRNPKDDRTGGVFAPDIRGNTDRFLFRLRKPK
ncbi:SAM-dependent methyltransferase [Gammaproteobacteria bacterium]|nr:SAM-dependent methyltransferase [Gammaproteobacteria bacterium]